jgi:predicted deacylase
MIQDSTESSSGGWLRADIAATYARGVQHVMQYLGILPGEPPIAPIERELFGEGDADTSIPAPASGFLDPKVDLREEVEAGDLLGVVEGLAGEPLAEIRAPMRGTVAMCRNTPAVIAGDITFLLT